MCRLFGFRSVIPSQVHRSLLAAENALGVQSNAHPDGWGVAFYVDGAPHVTRSPLAALGDQLFHRLSGVVSSQTVLAHVRRATHGPKTVFNCHPFQHGRWVFAHNGDVARFGEIREALLAEVAPRLRRFILGETDSEVVFFLFLSLLTELHKSCDGSPLDQALDALQKTVLRVRAIADGDGGPPSSLTLLATDGEVLVATHGGKELFVSTFKTRCSDRDSCANLAPSCEAPSVDGKVNHFVLSSEPLHGENVWFPLAAGELVGIDGDMRPRRGQVGRVTLPLAG